MAEEVKSNEMTVKCKIKGCQYIQDFSGWTFKEAVEWMKKYVLDNHQDMKCCHELEIINCNEPEAYKSLAYSFKDRAAEEKQLTQKLLRIIRELDKRITILENKSK